MSSSFAPREAIDLSQIGANRAGPDPHENSKSGKSLRVRTRTKIPNREISIGSGPARAERDREISIGSGPTYFKAVFRSERVNFWTPPGLENGPDLGQI